MNATDAESGETARWLALEGPDFLERRDEAWFRRQRWRAIERIGVGLLPLAGLGYLDWPAEALAVFLLLGILGSLAADWIKFAIAPQVVEDRVRHDMLDSRMWRVVEDLGAGRPPTLEPSDPRVEVPLYHLLLSSWMLLCLVGSLLYELRRVSGTDLLQAVLASPDMLLAMLGALVVQAVLGVVALRGLQRSSRPELELEFAPVVDATLAFLVLLGWMVGSMVVVNAGEALTGRDHSGAVIAVLVVAAYALQVLRGFFEWRWLGKARLARRRLEEYLGPESAAGRLSLA